VIQFTLIREYKPADFKEVFEVYKIAFMDPPWNETWTEEQVKDDIESALAKENPITIVAENSELVGFLWGYRKPEEKFGFLSEQIDRDSFYLDDVAVSNSRRKERIGTRLCQEFEKQVKESGGKKIFLRTQKDYTASNKLYDKLGYERSGVFDPEYPDREYLVKSLGD
jgi:ribosomal protein S18 acetylase RimI-like enzyme